MPKLTAEQAAAELPGLYARVESGVNWLVEHDPTGAFHMWFESGLTSLSPMPAQDGDRRDQWRAYYSARLVFEQLWRKMVTLEKVTAPA